MVLDKIKFACPISGSPNALLFPTSGISEFLSFLEPNLHRASSFDGMLNEFLGMGYSSRGRGYLVTTPLVKSSCFPTGAVSRLATSLISC